jgi:xanthine dehydrogenase YagT iron-sulfur-binding subunit
VTGLDSSGAIAPPVLDAIRLRINGVDHQLTIDTRTSRPDLLREHGAKKGCDHGQCGACTILIDGRRANACLALAVAHDGAEPTTVEGLADGDSLTVMQQAFIEHDAFQCGYCTPGQLDQTADPAQREVRVDTAEDVEADEPLSRHSFGAQFIEVALDGVTGEVRVPRALGVFAAGRIINAKTAQGSTSWALRPSSRGHHLQPVPSRGSKALSQAGPKVTGVMAEPDSR